MTVGMFAGMVVYVLLITGEELATWMKVCLLCMFFISLVYTSWRESDVRDRLTALEKKLEDKHEEQDDLLR